MTRRSAADIRVLGLLALLLGALVLVTGSLAGRAAWSQEALPPTPFVVDPFPARVGGIGFPYTAFPTEPLDPGRPWRLFGSIAVDAIGTNNVFQSTDRRSDVYLRIIPTIGLLAETERVLANIRYAPSAFLYSTYSSQNRFNQNFAAQGNLELIPGILFLDIQGFGYVQAASGGFGPQASGNVSRANEIQNYDVRISPYAVFRFGSAATAQVGYAFLYGDQSGNTQFLNVGNQTQPYFSGQSFIGNRGYVVLRTGEDFGRFAVIGRVDGTAYSGTGIYSNSHRALANVDVRYAITPNIAIQVGGGYESQAWNTLPRTRIDEAIWNVGVRLNAPGGSWMVLRYGHQDGFNSPYVNANVVLGGRMSMQVNYFERLSTAGLFAQDLLTSTSVDEIGNAVDTQARSLVPVSPLFGFNSILTAQSSLSRSRFGSGFLTQTWPRDRISVGVTYREQRPVAFTPGFTSFSQSGWAGVVSWTHDLTPSTSSAVYFQYGVTNSRVFGDGTFLTAGASLVHRLSANLQASLQLIGQQHRSTQSNRDWSSATVIAGIRQNF